MAEVRLVADSVTVEGIEHRVITLPVMANPDGWDHVEPTVERTLVRFEAARAGEEAIERAEDLRAEAERLRAQEYTALDRKYHHARGHGVWESKEPSAAEGCVMSQIRPSVPHFDPDRAARRA